MIIYKYRKEKRNIKKDGIYDLVFYLLIGVIIGARLFYVIFYWPKDTPLNFLDIFKIWEGGLSFFGGLIGALTAGYIYINKNIYGSTIQTSTS